MDEAVVDATAAARSQLAAAAACRSTPAGGGGDRRRRDGEWAGHVWDGAAATPTSECSHRPMDLRAAGLAGFDGMLPTTTSCPPPPAAVPTTTTSCRAPPYMRGGVAAWCIAARTVHCIAMGHAVGHSALTGAAAAAAAAGHNGRSAGVLPPATAADRLLAAGTRVAAAIRRAVLLEAACRCSAGIGACMLTCML